MNRPLLRALEQSETTCLCVCFIPHRLQFSKATFLHLARFAFVGIIIIIIIIGFCLTEVPVAMLMEDADGYMMGQEGERSVKNTHSLFVDDLKVYQENHQKLEVVNGIIVKASMDTGACYGVKKCAEIVFKKGKMVKGIGLAVLEEKMKALDSSSNENYKFFGCEQADKINVKRVIERVKNEIMRRLNYLMSLHLNDQNLMKAINCRVIPVAGYVMNVCNLWKSELDELDNIKRTEE